MERRRIYVLLTLVVISWGGAFTAIRILVQDVSVFTVSFVRFALTTIGLLAASAVMRPERRPIERADRGKVLVLALTGVVIYHVSLNFGERYVSADVASLIVASMPVMVALLSRSFLKERIGPAKWLGIGIALSGVVVLITKGAPGAALEVESLGGAAVVALAPLSWATYTIVSKPLVPTYGPLPLVTAAMALGTLLLAPVGIPAALHDLGQITPGDWAWLVFLALACSTFAYAVWFYALEVLSASEVTVWVYFVPLAAVVWAAITLGERLTWFIAFGGALVLVGVILTERVPARARPREDRPTVG